MATTSYTDFKVEASKVKWDPKAVEIRTRSVEKTLEPLVHQVKNGPKFVGLNILQILSLLVLSLSGLFSYTCFVNALVFEQEL